MKRILIIADDLSGAADCGIGCVKAGLETTVILDGRPDHGAGTSATQALAIDTDTRRLPASEAARIQSDALRRYRLDDQLLYKKMDSTLRGNFGAELAALLDDAGMAIVAPAFPQAERVTRNGRQYVKGVALEETDIWHGEGMAGAADIAGMLAIHGTRTALLPLATLREGTRSAHDFLLRCMERGAQAVVCDAETDGDLQAIAQAAVALPGRVFWVGSAGLARHLPAAMGLGAPSPSVPPEAAVDGAILTVVGSFSGVSRGQADRLLAARPVSSLALGADLLRQAEAHADWQAQRNRLRHALEGGQDLLLSIAADGPVDPAEGWLLCQTLGRMVAPLAGRLGGLIATGGETARAVLSAMEIGSLRLTHEVEPGIPLSLADGMRAMPVITKAGAFGSDEALVRCYDMLHRIRAAPRQEQKQPAGTPAASIIKPTL